VRNSRAKGIEVKCFNAIAGGEGPIFYELGIDNSRGNPTYTPTTLTKEEILENHRSVLCSFGISTKDVAGGEGPIFYVL
jgi:N-methylhydantoinase B/oxoprolinase/acetone carboxylase alpha subunit